MLAAMALGSASRYLFTRRTGQPLWPDNLTDRLNQLAIAAKVRPLGPHQIRRMLASNLLDTGYGIHEVAERLGHNPATLMRYYAKASATRCRQAGDRIAELVTAPERPPGRTDFITASPLTVVPGDGQEDDR